MTLWANIGIQGQYLEVGGCITPNIWHKLNHLRAKFFRGSINIYLHFVSFIHIDTTQVVEILSQIRQEPTYQYHGCWCLGSLRNQGISSHDIDIVKRRWLGPRTLRVLTYMQVCLYHNISISAIMMTSWHRNAPHIIGPMSGQSSVHHFPS